jgi:predicted TIM-barrel fold metal-dependent hydrolase
MKPTGTIGSSSASALVPRPMVIDAHTHLFPPEVVGNRQYFVERDPWFAQAFGHPSARTAEIGDLIASMDEGGIARSLVCGWPWRDPSICRIHNDYLAHVARQHANRISWLAIVNPADVDAAQEVERCVSLGAVGVGELNADGQGFEWQSPQPLAACVDACVSLGVPVMLHASEPIGHLYPGKGHASPDKLVGFLSVFPKLCVVAAHWGGGLPFYELMPEIAEITRNVVYDTAASTYLYDVNIFPVVERLVGARRILFGSDYPVLRQRQFVRRVLDSGLALESLEDVFHGNAGRVFGISPWNDISGGGL